MTTHTIRYYINADPCNEAFTDTLFCQDRNDDGFDGGSFTNCTFVNCMFTGRLYEYVFTNCTFTGCDFLQVVWDACQWKHCVWDDATRGVPTMAEERKRLVAVVTQVDATPHLLDMTMWDTKTECGTAYCIGGWLIHLFADVSVPYLDRKHASRSHNHAFALAPNASAYFYRSNDDARAWLAQFRASAY